MHVIMPPHADTSRRLGPERVTVTTELRAYLCYRTLSEGMWSYDLPDGRRITSSSPAIQVSLSDLYKRGQVSLRPVDSGHLASMIWQGIFLEGKTRHSASVTYAETIPSGFDLTEALAMEALRACID